MQQSLKIKYTECEDLKALEDSTKTQVVIYLFMTFDVICFCVIFKPMAVCKIRMFKLL